MPKVVAFSARARRDLQWEWSYLLEDARPGIEDAFLTAVDETAAKLFIMPRAGIQCNFKSPRLGAFR